MVDNRISKARVRHHFSYGLWKYALLAAAAIFGWNLFYSMTAYRPPDNKKLDIYVVTPGANTEAMQTDLLESLQAAFPDQEEFSFMNIALGADQDSTAVMQFTTYIAAQQGDVFLLSMDLFHQYGRDMEDGLFMALDGAIASGELNAEGIDTELTRITPQEGASGIYGISTKTLYGLTDYLINNESMVLAVPVYSGNQENAIKLVDFLVKRFATEKPEWYDEYQNSLREQQQQEQQQQLFMNP